MKKSRTACARPSRSTKAGSFTPPTFKNDADFQAQHACGKIETHIKIINGKPVVVVEAGEFPQGALKQDEPISVKLNFSGEAADQLREAADLSEMAPNSFCNLAVRVYLDQRRRAGLSDENMATELSEQMYHVRADLIALARQMDAEGKHERALELSESLMRAEQYLRHAGVAVDPRHSPVESFVVTLRGASPAQT